LEFLELYRGLLLHGAERFSQTTFAGSFRDADGKRRLTLETKRAAETVIWFFDRDDLELRAIAKPSLAGEGRLQLELIRDQQAGQDGSPPAPSRLRLHRSG